MTALLTDIRYAVRRLLARRSFTTIVLLSLALGISANVVIFSLARAVLSNATPYPEAPRVVLAWFTPPGNPGARVLATPGNCAALRERARSFEHLGCVRPDRPATLADAGAAEARSIMPTRIKGQEFTAEIPRVLGVAPRLGRWFTLEEERNAEPVAVIGHGLWQRQFDGAADVVGRRVLLTNRSLKGETVTIVGVAPTGFQFLDNRTDVWVPLVAAPGDATSPARGLLVVGRLKSGVTSLQAQAELNAIARALAAETPFTNKGWGIRIEPVQTTLRQGIGRPVVILQVVVVLVLLVACANVAGLLLAEGIARGGEMAVRTAVGASRWRIFRQCLTESVLISSAGSLLGLAFAWLGLRLLITSLPADIPGLDTASLDLTVLVFTVVMLLLTALAFGVAPALRASRCDIANVLNGAARRGTPLASDGSLRGAFVTGQIGLAAALSVGAGLMILSLIRLGAVHPGIEPDGIVTFQVHLDGRDYLRETGRLTPSGAAETELTPRLYAAAGQIREGVAGLTGVAAVTGTAAAAPFSGAARRFGFTAAGSRLTGATGEPAMTDWFPVLPDYFRTLGIPVLHGRALAETDTAAGLPVIVINEAMADELWPGQDPIGREVQMRLFNDPPRRVVGIVADVRHSAASRERLRQSYVPLAQVRRLQSAIVAEGLEALTFVIRTDGRPPLNAQMLSQVVAHAAPNRAVVRVQPLQRYLDDQLAGYRLYVFLLLLFGTVASALAVVGTYALTTDLVYRRLHEIGIRMALGATRGQTLWLVMRRGMALASGGVALGLMGGLMLAGVLERYLWEVTVTEPIAFTVVPAMLFGVCVAASYIAARPALAADPASIMRQD